MDERQKFRPEIEWPTEVNQEVLSKIKECLEEYPNSNVVTGIAFFLVIYETGDLLEEITRKELSPDLEEEIGNLVFLHYSSANALLSTTQVFERGEPMHKMFNTDILTEEDLQAMGKTREQIENEVAVESADEYVQLMQLSKILKTMEPLQFIDYYTSLMLKRHTLPQAKVALETGQQRFHQLYKAVQEEGLS